MGGMLWSRRVLFRGTHRQVAGRQQADQQRHHSFVDGVSAAWIQALVIAEIERRIQKRAGPQARVSDYFQMFAGTSTSGLVRPQPDRAGPAGPSRRRQRRRAGELLRRGLTRIFHPRPLAEDTRTLCGGQLGPSPRSARCRTRSSAASERPRSKMPLRELIACSYDMTDRQGPYFLQALAPPRAA